EDGLHQPVLRISARRVAHHALVVGEIGLEVERVLPVELGGRVGPHRLVGTLLGGLRHGGLPGLAPFGHYRRSEGTTRAAVSALAGDDLRADMTALAPDVRALSYSGEGAMGLDIHHLYATHRQDPERFCPVDQFLSQMRPLESYFQQYNHQHLACDPIFSTPTLAPSTYHPIF